MVADISLVDNQGDDIPHNHRELLDRITIDPKVMAGKPVIKGTRLTVQYILELIADGTNFENITEEYKSLTKEDIIACLLYASESIDHPTFLPLNNEA